MKTKRRYLSLERAEVFTGKTFDETKVLAAEAFGVDELDIRFEIIEWPKKGLFGSVKGQFRVRAICKQFENETMKGQEKFQQGMKYLQGDGVSQNFEQATILFEEAVKDGVYDAAFYLAKINQLGKTANSSMLKAIEWYEFLAGSPNDAEAKQGMFEAGMLYCQWENPEQWNPQKGRDWLEKFIAKVGKENLSFDACERLGDRYATGGVRLDRDGERISVSNYIEFCKDLEESIWFFRKALELADSNVDPKLIELMQAQIENQLKRIECLKKIFGDY
jgi:TPR repeat protein